MRPDFISSRSTGRWFFANRLTKSSWKPHLTRYKYQVVRSARTAACAAGACAARIPTAAYAALARMGSRTIAAEARNFFSMRVSLLRSAPGPRGHHASRSARERGQLTEDIQWHRSWFIGYGGADS